MWRLSDYRSIHLAVGKLNVDVIVKGLDQIPPPDTPVYAEDVEIVPGGAATNYSVAISRFGHSVKLLSKVGIGPTMKGIMTSLAELGVGLEYVQEEQYVQSPTLIFLRNDGSISIVRKKNSVPPITREEVNRFAGLFDVVHFASLPPQLVLRDPYAKVTSYDPGPTVREIVDPLEVDVLFVNNTEAEKLDMEKVKTRYLVVKKGKKGATVTSEVEECSVDAIQVDPVDTTGAGDVFDAAFNFGLAEEWSLEETLQFASVASGLKVTRLGGTSSPSFQEVVSFLNEKPPKVKCR
ncbi:carbohydrate kinase family protein [Sulfuracidifex metallicus]|uniref:Carbohydrate kinase family protein n=1 Tax=Sulfuracidifex metallicus DSM 6482 = JCM 9184 TaxID=523847 RepID=A0A6A9QKL0_SULME|nr:carbohydrate kinase family protein [Sulfuracidifex metallicus]MUN29556.1 carbohydrate kinase family protein [Sulfuracidifex metallicus DSM 6482 = JCM 9184]WOE51964.1 carbohydrate kinase family protein [Sulfuracidifex metallicus DSM 6482 = JCM 9184]